MGGISSHPCFRFISKMSLAFCLKTLCIFGIQNANKVYKADITRCLKNAVFIGLF